MAESLGTARLDVTVDISDWEAGIAKAKSRLADMTEAAQLEYQKLDKSEKRRVDSLNKQIDTLNLGREGVIAYNATLLGNGRISDALTDKIIAQKEASHQLALEQKKIAETNAFQKAATQAQELAKADTYVRNYTKALDDAEKAQQSLAEKNSFVASLKQQSAQIGKTRADLLEMKAAELGVTKESAPFVAALRAQEVAAGKASIEFNQYGRSAKQVTAALRNTPAQITDIFVSLQGGQNPLTVLLQQGGQLKDLFGGIAPAARALGSQLLALINPYTAAAAAAAVLGVALFQSQKQLEELRVSLALSGNYANLTGKEITGLVNKFDELNGVTSADAVEALTEIFRTGQIAKQNIEQVSLAAIVMQDVTGKAIKDTVAEFVSLGKDPVTAILKLNESQNFLTQATLDQIIAAKEQGDSIKAIDLATTDYANNLITRAADARNSLGLFSSSWLELKKNSADAWSTIVNGFTMLESKLKSAVANLNNFQLSNLEALRNLTKYTGTGAFIQTLLDDSGVGDRKPVAKATGAATKINSADAAKYVELINAGKSKEVLFEEKIVEYRRAALAVTKDQVQVEKLVAAYRKIEADKIKPKRDGSARSFERADNKANLQAFKDDLLVEQTAIQNQSRILQAEYGNRLITTDSYYAQTRALAQRDLNAQQLALRGQIDVLKARNAIGKDTIDTQRELATLEAQLSAVRAKGATDLKVLDLQESESNRRRTEELRQFKLLSDKNLENTKIEFENAVLKTQLSDQEYARQVRLNEVTRKYAEAILAVKAAKDADGTDPAKYDEEIRILKEASDKEVAVIREGYAKRKEAEQDWLTGIKKGLEDWKDQASDVSGQIAALTKSGLDKATDALVEFATTGKLQWKQLLADILKQIAAFLIKQAVLSFLKLLSSKSETSSSDSGSGTSTVVGVIGSVIGAYFGKSSASPGTLSAPTLPAFNATSGGKLGTASAGKTGPISLSISTTINNDGSSKSSTENAGEQDSAVRQFSERMRAIAQDELTNATRVGGLLWRAGLGVN